MMVAIAVAFYAGIVVMIARFLSLNSRWERAVSALIEADVAALGAAVPAGVGAEGLATMMTPRRPMPSRPQRSPDPEPVSHAAARVPAPASPSAMHADSEREPEQELVEVGF